LGAEVWEASVDITDRKQVENLIAQLTERGLPLLGVLHAAATFDDVLLRDLNRERFESVMLPKTLGAFHLHEATRGHPLDFFVLFSSTSALVGSMGQSAYAAGNVYLDAFAHWRRAQGLPATSINWGFIGEVGISARNTVVNGYLRRVGLRPFSPSYANDIMYRIVEADLTQIGVVDIDWQQWANCHPAWAASARFKHLIMAHEGEAGSGREDFVQSLLAMDEAARLNAIHDAIKHSVAQTMLLSPAAIQDDYSLVSLGLDSLMAMELQVAIERDLGVTLSTLEMLKGNPILELSQNVLKRLMGEVSERPTSAADAPIEASSGATSSVPRIAPLGDALRASDGLDRLAELSAEELDSLVLDLSRDNYGVAISQHVQEVNEAGRN
jgi:acyl carrier protein